MKLKDIIVILLGVMLCIFLGYLAFTARHWWEWIFIVLPPRSRRLSRIVPTRDLFFYDNICHAKFCAKGCIFPGIRYNIYKRSVISLRLGDVLVFDGGRIGRVSEPAFHMAVKLWALK